MKINVKEKIDGDKIIFECPYGTGIGIWKEDEPIPEEPFYAEIGIPGTISVKNIKKSSLREVSLCYSGGAVILTGILEQINPDGIHVIRAGDSLIMIMTDVEIPFPVGSYIQFQSPYLELNALGY